MGKQNIVLRMLPDLSVTRKLASSTQIAMMNRYAMDSESVTKGENDPLEKKRLTEIYMQKWKKKGAQINKLIEEQINKIPSFQGRSDIEAIRMDMRFCFFAYGFLPNEYFPYQLEHLNRKERESFISERLRIIFRCRMNDILAANLLKDKSKTYQLLKQYFGREAIAINSEKDYEVYKAFVKRHPRFVKKEVFESLGNSVSLIDLKTCGKDAKTLFTEFIKRGKHILEEPIQQSEALSAYNVSSVNTVRCITMNTKKGIVYPYCMLRTGRPGNFVDNGGAGGIMAGIDAKTGIIYTDGYDEVGGIYVEHPGTGKVFQGSQMPEWKELLALCRTLAETIPQLRFIGWDMAHTEKGWVVVEGNECCQLIGKQMLDHRGLRKEFERIMQDMDLVV